MINMTNLYLKRSNRAAVLIMTMMAITLTFMMIYVLTQTSGFGLNSTSSFYDREAALQAAQSGMDYAITQLQANREWKGDCHRAYWKDLEGAYRNYTGSEAKDFKVLESYGNVVGVLTNRAGYKSAFRIKFNYELPAVLSESEVQKKLKEIPCSSFEGKDGKEHMPDVLVNMPYVSINNLTGNTEALMYRANDNGQGICEETDNLEITSQDSPRRMYANHVPPQRICIIVEGIAGNGLRECSNPEDVYDIVNNNVVTRRYVEAYYTFNAPVLRGYAAYSKGALNATTKNMYVKSVGYQNAEYKIPAPGSICSSTSININGKLNTYDGTVYSPIEPKFNTDDTKYTFYKFKGKRYEHITKDSVEVTFQRAPVEITSGTDSASVDVNKVATANSSEGYKLRSGLYQWHTAADSTDAEKRYELRYYPDEKEPFTTDAKGRPIPSAANKYNYEIMVASTDEEGEITINTGSTEKTIYKKAFIPKARSGKVLFGEAGKISSPNVQISGQVYCDGPLAIGVDLNEVVDCCPVFWLKPDNYYDPVTGRMDDKRQEDGVLHAAGNMTLVSMLKGNGALIAKDARNNPCDISMIGESAMKSDSTGLAVYGRDVTLLSLDAGTTKSLDFKRADLAAISDNGSGVPRKPTPEDLTFSFTPDELLTMYNEGKFTDGNGNLDRDKAKKAIKDYALKEKHVSIDMGSFEPMPFGDNNGFYFTFKFMKAPPNDKCDVAESKFYQVLYPVIGADWVKYCTDLEDLTDMPMGATPLPEFTMPEESFYFIDDGTSDSGDSGDIEENGTYSRPIDYEKLYKDISYGDQVFNGVICATRNFTADLGSKRLIVNGAIRAENGAMNLTCSTIDLTYDEDCVSKLLPLYCNLTCGLWNCW